MQWSTSAFAQTNKPVERIFAILAGLPRAHPPKPSAVMAALLGRLALGNRDAENRPAHDLIAQNFKGWIGAVHSCLEQAQEQLPPGTDIGALATYVLAVMEGGVMIGRSYGSVEPFDSAVAQLREHFRLLLTHASKSLGGASL